MRFLIFSGSVIQCNSTPQWAMAWRTVSPSASVLSISDNIFGLMLYWFGTNIPHFFNSALVSIVPPRYLKTTRAEVGWRSGRLEVPVTRPDRKLTWLRWVWNRIFSEKSSCCNASCSAMNIRFALVVTMPLYLYTKRASCNGSLRLSLIHIWRCRRRG